LSIGARIIPNPYPFLRLRKKLRSINIIWHPEIGKGSHGAFVGDDLRGEKQVYVLPRHQQKDVSADYLKVLRRRFLLTGEEWDKFFASK